jgi:prefoldin subunit 5
MTSDSGRWPLLEERGPFATASRQAPGRKLPRPAWVLLGLAFLCGGLVSAAAFSIGWRHQAQRNTAAQSALAAANARAHRLERKIGALQSSLADARGAAARAQASATTAGRGAARVADDATAAGGDATSISSRAGSLTAAATRLASELKTLDTYLTATPSGQLDPGYIASQTAYLARQLSRLQGEAGSLGSSASSFETTLRKLESDAKALQTR